MAQATRLFVLRDPAVRQRAADYILRGADDGSEVLVTPERMNRGQQSKFHAICRDLARSGLEWFGEPRTALQWKLLLMSGHAIATHEEAEVIEGLEGEPVNVRESTTTMSKKRGASLISYSMAFADLHGVRLKERHE